VTMNATKTDYSALPENSLFPLVGILFVAVLIISNISAQKLFAFGPFTFSGGIILFPVAYIFGDVLTEVYGYARARLVIWAGFASNILLAVVLWIVIQLPPATGWPLQEEFAKVLGLVPRIVVASIIGYWAGEFSNSFVLARLKVLMEGRMLWVRTISSTIVGEAVDTMLFVVIAFAGVFPMGLLIEAIWSGYLFKVLYEVVATPFTYIIVGYLKRREGTDVYDRTTDFSPFRLSVRH
jgi:queuosine precursor transporter